MSWTRRERDSLEIWTNPSVVLNAVEPFARRGGNRNLMVNWQCNGGEDSVILALT